MHEFVSDILEASPRKALVTGTDELVECIRACLACAQACVACADACLSEDTVEALRTCIRLNHDCADICDVTASVLTRSSAGSEVIRLQVELCAEICRECGAECARHAGHHEHCRICADACRSCEEACRSYLDDLAAAGARAQ